MDLKYFSGSLLVYEWNTHFLASLVTYYSNVIIFLYYLRLFYKSMLLICLALCPGLLVPCKVIHVTALWNSGLYLALLEVLWCQGLYKVSGMSCAHLYCLHDSLANPCTITCSIFFFSFWFQRNGSFLWSLRREIINRQHNKDWKGSLYPG